MSTRSRIARKLENGDYRSIYCHWDGYPEHHLPILTKYYNTIEKIDALLDLGDISVLAPSIGDQNSFDNRIENTVLAYHRDRGEPKDSVKAIISFGINDLRRDASCVDYLYIFDNNQWKVVED